MNGSYRNLSPAARGDRAVSAWLWPALLVASSAVGSYVFTCATPFAALAAIAAATLAVPQALAVIVAIWALNQAIGFGFLDYPWTLDTALWGLALGAAAVIALAATMAMLRLVLRSSTVMAHAAAFFAAFLAYQASLFAVALVLGGLEDFAPAIVAQILVLNLIWFAAFLGGHEAAKRWGWVAPYRVA